MDLNSIKQRFGIIGDTPELNRALETAYQVSGTDLSVLVTGESGVGKEVIPQIIHTNSPRKHNSYFAVNCGAIPEGTIDSELFGHEKGSFTGAIETRKGYFEEADGGTIFLDEVAELPLSTQVRLLRVLQTGEFIKVGSSKVQKTDVRVVAATNVNLMHAIEHGKFREDLFYRLNTVPIIMPPLRERKQDIVLLFKKFALDFADKYMTPVIRLSEEAQQMLISYRWPGNVRQLKSIAEQISVLEKERQIDALTLSKYIDVNRQGNLPAKTGAGHPEFDYETDRDIIFKILFQLRSDVDRLKTIVEGGDATSAKALIPQLISDRSNREVDDYIEEIKEIEEGLPVRDTDTSSVRDDSNSTPTATTKSLNVHEAEIENIRLALEKHGGNRKAAAKELGISERTLYRKLKDEK